MKKVFAALFGALALIIVPPGMQDEPLIPIVLDLSASHHAAPPAAITIAIVWPLVAPQ